VLLVKRRYISFFLLSLLIIFNLRVLLDVLNFCFCVFLRSDWSSHEETIRRVHDACAWLVDEVVHGVPLFEHGLIVEVLMMLHN
jgi:hypothetical protein